MYHRGNVHSTRPIKRIKVRKPCALDGQNGGQQHNRSTQELGKGNHLKIRYVWEYGCV